MDMDTQPLIALYRTYRRLRKTYSHGVVKRIILRNAEKGIYPVFFEEHIEKLDVLQRKIGTKVSKPRVFKVSIIQDLVWARDGGLCTRCGKDSNCKIYKVSEESPLSISNFAVICDTCIL